MFDIGFPELLIVAIVALVVIGPEKLPETVRTVALWVGRIRRSLANIKMELEQEIGADDIRRQLHNESIMSQLKETKTDLDNLIKDANGSINEIRKAAELDTSVLTPSVPKNASATSSETPSNDR